MKNIIANIKALKTKDVVVALLILVLPFLFYLYKLAPDTPIWDTGWLLIDSGIWESANLYLWLFCTKLLIIISLSIWFVTCKHWWRYVILVPLIIELFKFSSFYKKSEVIDEIEYLQGLPFIIPVILFILFISKKINYYSNYIDLYNEMNNEVESILSDLEYNNNSLVKEEFKNLKKKKSLLSKVEYKNELLRLRKQLAEK
ncbi:hypothetical protein [Lacinutrix cladophorae]